MSNQYQITNDLIDALENLKAEIDKKSSPATSPNGETVRVMQIKRLRQLHDILEELIEVHNEGIISDFPLLSKIRYRRHVELVLGYEEVIENKSHADDYYKMDKALFERLGIGSLQQWEQAYKDLTGLIDTNNPMIKQKLEQDAKISRLRDLYRKVENGSIPGFIRLPFGIISQMIRLAEIKEGNKILDPSAGAGELLNEVRIQFENVATMWAMESNPVLAEILDIEEFSVLGNDFLNYNDKKFDRILMNPPLSNGMDLEYIKHGYDLLNPSGRLVSIISEDVFFSRDKKQRDFMRWLDTVDAAINHEFAKEVYKNVLKRPFRIIVISKEQSVEGIPLDQEHKELEQLAKEAIEKLNKEMEQDLSVGIKTYTAYEDTAEHSYAEDQAAIERAGIPEIMLTYKRQDLAALRQIRTSKQAYEILKELFEKNTIDLHERFLVLYLNRANYVIGYYSHSIGGINATITDVRLIMAAALNCLCSSMIICHNHPSGNLEASFADKELTKDVETACRYHKMKLSDHIIITSEGYYSMADNADL